MHIYIEHASSTFLPERNEIPLEDVNCTSILNMLKMKMNKETNA